MMTLMIFGGRVSSLLALAILSLAVSGGCAVEESPKAEKSKKPAAAKTPAVSPERLYAKGSSYSSFKQACKKMEAAGEPDHWSCYVASAKWTSPDRVTINLNPSPRFTEKFTDEMARKAANGFLGAGALTSKSLQSVIVQVKGVEQEYKKRSDLGL